MSQDLLVHQRALREANRAFFAAANGDAKRRVRNQIKDLREKIAAEVKRDHAFAGEDARNLAAWDPFDPNAFAPFFDGEWMFGLDASSDEGWFDIAFANPPYIRQEKIESFKINGKPVVSKAQLKADYRTFAGTADIYVYFYERALRLLKPSGALAFITSNKWYRISYGKGLRDWLSTHAHILAIIDFGDAPVFEAIAYPTILIGTRKLTPAVPDPNEVVRALHWMPVGGEDPRESVKHFPQRFSTEAFDMPQAELAASADWQFIPRSSGKLLTRLRSSPLTLRDFVVDTVYRGITTGYNEAFEISDAERLALIAEDESSGRIIKPLLKGKDLSRWMTPAPTRWIIFARRGLRIADYPAIERHLSKYRNRLEPKPKGFTAAWSGRKPGNYEWFEIQDNVAYWPTFEKKKIVSNKITDKQNFSIDETNAYLANTTYCFEATEAEFVTGVLNSTTLQYVARRVFSDKEGGFYEVQPTALLDLPMPLCGPEDRKLLTTVVSALVAGANRPRLEALINAFVYELFFAEELHAQGLAPFLTARKAQLANLEGLKGSALASTANDWSHCLADPAHPLYATIFDLQSIDAVKIIEGQA